MTGIIAFCVANPILVGLICIVVYMMRRDPKIGPQMKRAEKQIVGRAKNAAKALSEEVSEEDTQETLNRR